jgi:DNA-binding transcriptional ArsR family regulator
MDILKAIADDTRMAILQTLKEGPLSVSDIEKKTGKSHSTTSQQLKSLATANLVTFKKEGTQKFYQIKDSQIFDMLESISSYLSTAKVVSEANVVKGKKVLLMGLDRSGKTSILLSFLGNKNIMSFMNQNLKATKGMKHMTEILSELKLKTKKTPDAAFYEYGGQVVYREQFKKDPQSKIRGFEKIIYVIDIQNAKRYKESIDYLKDIIESLVKISPTFELDLFLHKFDPDIDIEEKYSQQSLNEKLITPIQQLLPVGFKTTIYRTSIYTVFRKSLMMQTYQSI